MTLALHTPSNLEVPRLQTTKHSVWVILLLNLSQLLPVLISVPRKDILSDVCVILINITVMQPHFFCRSSDSINDVPGCCLARIIVLSLIPLEVDREDCKVSALIPYFFDDQHTDQRPILLYDTETIAAILLEKSNLLSVEKLQCHAW